ncbi:MAG TPA: helix-hairpin-helix domain-containing protein [Ignavibacteriaceae bacterium]|nr:helix-hairpin-helix domain-containing protein [Ignavibacteriaceae bacterium]
MIKSTFSLIILFKFFSILTFAQVDTTYLKTEDILEELIDETSEESDNSELFDRFEYYINYPIDINTANLSELLQLPLLDISSANLIIDHRNKFGSFFSVQELFAIRGLPLEVINKLLPFIAVSKKPIESITEKTADKIPLPKLSNIRFNIRSRFINDLQTRRGFTEERYLGSKLKNYNRILIRQGNNYQLGFLTDKDPGETSFTDFTSFHFMIKDIGIIKSIVLGDYLLEFGQGLALWSPYAITKSTDAIYPAHKNARGLRPYTSSTETNFLRGGAATFQIDKFFFTAFYSQNKFDANIESESGFITSRPVDGFHRTESELLRKYSAEEKILGGVIQYQPISLMNMGFLAYNVNLSRPLLASSTLGMSGNNFNYLSFFYEAIYKNIKFVGEFAYDMTSVASVNGLQFSLTRNFSFVTAFRNYPRNYSNFLGSGFGERAGATNNEIGFYTGFRWRIPLGLLNVYYDQFKFPYRTFTNVSPSEGDEILTELVSKPFTNTETKIRFKYENKDVSQTIDDLRQVTKRLRQSVRIDIAHHPSRTIRLRSRVEYNYFRISESNIMEDGLLVFQDIRFNGLSDLVVYGRFIIFYTDSFNSAVYEYENDLTGVMTNLPMYGEGLRWYFIARYKVLKSFTISLKYSETYKPKEDFLSSGNNLIPNNLDNRISFQIDMNF